MSRSMGGPSSLIIVGRAGPDGLEAMLIYSMSVSVDGFIADRDGAFGWTAPERGAVSFPHRAGKQARRLSVRPQALRTMLPWEG